MFEVNASDPMWSKAEVQGFRYARQVYLAALAAGESADEAKRRGNVAFDCAHVWKADMSGVDLVAGTAERFFHRCAKCGAEDE